MTSHWHILKHIFERKYIYEKDSRDLLERHRQHRGHGVQKARAAIHNMSLYLDPSDDAPAIAEKMGIDAEKLPLLILALPGNIGGRAYAGYNVGSVGLMLRLMEEAAKA